MEKELTIIMPTYNDTFEKIKRSLDSIASQTEYDNLNLEIIVVDDASTSEHVDWNEMLKLYPLFDIKYTKFPENKGPGIARQFALNIASGNFVFFLDCGDTLFDNSVLKTFNNQKKLDCDIISTKLYDLDTGNKRRSFIFNNAYIFGIFIRTQFLKENNIKFNDVLRWEEDAFFEEILRYYSPKIISTGTIGYTYHNDNDSITRQNDHEYQNNFGGFSAMIVKTILLCEFYKEKKDYNYMINEIISILSVCYSRFYNDLFQKQDISERISKILFLLRCLVEQFGAKTDSEDFVALFAKNMYKKNYIYEKMDKVIIPYDKINEFILIIHSHENLYGNYIIEGTNITIDELLATKNNEIKKR